MNQVFQYVLRTEDDQVTSCGFGYPALKSAIDDVIRTNRAPDIAILERGPVTIDLADWQGTIVAVASREPLLGLGERGKLWITREMNSPERIVINHFSQKLSALDVWQTRVVYAYRATDLSTTSTFEPGLAGLANAIRGARSAGCGLIVRIIHAVEGEQVISVCTESGNYFTQSVDESERGAMQMIRAAMEQYGEFPAVLPLDDPDTRARLLAALSLGRRGDPITQSSAFHNFLGRGTAVLSGLLGAAAAIA